MGNTTTQKAKILTDVSTTTKEAITSSCSAICTTEANNNTVIIGGRAKNVTIVAKCTASADCIMSNQIISSIENTLLSAVSQSSKSVTDLFNDGVFSNKVSNTTNIKNTLVNNTTSLTESTCQATSSGSTDNNFIYVEPSGRAGNLLVSSDSGASASCTMTNLSKSLVQNQISNTADQKAKNIGMFAYIFMVLLAIVVVGGVILIILAATGVLGSAFKGSGSGNSDEAKQPGSSGNQGANLQQLASQFGGKSSTPKTGGGGGGSSGLAAEAEEVVVSNPELLLL